MKIGVTEYGYDLNFSNASQNLYPSNFEHFQDYVFMFQLVNA